MSEPCLLQSDTDLTAANSLSLTARARWFAEPNSDQQAIEVLQQYRDKPLYVIGAGSNLVLAGDLDGLVLRPAMKGVVVKEENSEAVLLEAQAGEKWDALVAHCVAHGWHGIENLSWIPGSVGAAPFQNIGAYGVELADCLEYVRAINIADGSVHTFSQEQCNFSYRDSIFKSTQRGCWLITSVALRLSRRFAPLLEYGDLKARFQALPQKQRTAIELRNIIIAVRQAKLPDPAVLANAGSFFKNPEVSSPVYQSLLVRFPRLVAHALPNGCYKLAAGWLIEQAGWKGKRVGPVGMHERQALVLVNYGGATAADIQALAGAVQGAVKDFFGVWLEQEPVVLP